MAWPVEHVKMCRDLPKRIEAHRKLHIAIFRQIDGFWLFMAESYGNPVPTRRCVKVRQFRQIK